MANEIEPKKIERYQPTDLGGSGIKIREFSPQTIRSGTGSAEEYKTAKQKFGSFASTDSERKDKSPKAASFELHPDARRLLGVEEEERNQVSEIIQIEVDAKIAELTAEAKREGFIQGMIDGRDEAEKKILKEAREHFDRFTLFLSEVEKMKSELWAANERALIDLLFQISKQVMLKELKLDRDYVVRLSKEIIEHIGIRDNVKIRVNQRDFQEIEYLKSKLQAEVGDLKNLQILLSEEVGEAGCKIESELTEVDAGIQIQINQLRNALDGQSGDSNQ